MPHGYHGKILVVNLSTGQLHVDQHDEAWYRTYMGGTNFGMYYILKHMPPGADALGPDNVLTLMLSVLTGAPFSGQSRMTANAKSPLTGAIGDAQAGGFFPAEMKNAGFDGVVVLGKAAKPVYLWLNNGQAELRDASGLWGLGSWETETRIREELGENKVEVACCGPAGENSRAHRRHHQYAKSSRRTHRDGRGDGVEESQGGRGARDRCAPPTPMRKASRPWRRWAPPSSRRTGECRSWASLGTAGVVLGQEFSGGLPTRNYQSGTFVHAEEISGERLAETILVSRDTCYACVVRCKREVETNDEYQIKRELGGPEYETIATFGSYCEIRDLAAVSKANALCNDYGLDTIGAGATIAWAIECYEDGILTDADTDGLALRWGDARRHARRAGGDGLPAWAAGQSCWRKARRAPRRRSGRTPRRG
jgi:aldehyde:ferredoxin oxidoreductase